MANKWKSKREVNIPEEIRAIPPLALIDRMRNFCTPRNVPETYIDKNIPKIKEKPHYKIVYDSIEKLREFDLQTLIIDIHGLHISNGVLQRKVLAHMSCMGIVSVRLETFEDEKGKTRRKLHYTFIPENERVECKYLKNNQCDFNWSNGRKEKMFEE